ncbi:MAG: amidohydrolase family protein [Bryobacteraceae bacterium]
MHSPWGELGVSDAHVHFFSHRFFASLSDQAKIPPESLATTLGWHLPDDNPEHLAGLWVRELDRHGVSKAALIASIPGDHNSVMAAVKRFPQRFYGYAMVNPLAPEAAADAESALSGGHIHALCFFPAMHRYTIQDERVSNLLGVVAAHPGTAAFVHCGVLSVGVRKKLGLPSLFDLRFSNPIDLHAVAMRYPQIRFIVPHFGAGYFREALMLCDLCPNVWLDTSSSNSWMRYQSAHLDLREVFRRVLDVIGPSRLLFGTDSSFFPRGWNAQLYETQSTALYEAGLKIEAAQMIFHENLTHLFA